MSAEDEVERLREAIALHRAIVEAAGDVTVVNQESRARAAIKHRADLNLWALARAAGGLSSGQEAK